MNPFPAVVIGGPPHSGKSVLTYLLTQRLRALHVEHYVLRACPDGEGDWSQETSPETVRLLRQKGSFSHDFVARICNDLEKRHLPLIVDVGGKPTRDQERILDRCTHAVLISASEEGLVEWRDRFERHGVQIIAELHSVLEGEDRLDAETPTLRGQIANLERFTGVAGPVVEALAQRLHRLMAYSADDLRGYHLPRAPTELVVDIDKLAQGIGLPPEQRWQPAHIPNALRYVPQETSISIYGRGPNWLYAALALHAAPRSVYLFDPRMGWIAPVTLHCAPSAHPAAVGWTVETFQNHTWIELKATSAYIDYDEVNGAMLPPIEPARGVVLSGKLPYWLLVGAVLAYRHHPWLAVVQAQKYDECIVVMSRDTTHRPGSCFQFRTGP
ncbi:MAG: CRISPR-associated protein Csx3 [Roseiflexus sp.]